MIYWAASALPVAKCFGGALIDNHFDGLVLRFRRRLRDERLDSANLNTGVQRMQVFGIQKITFDVIPLRSQWFNGKTIKRVGERGRRRRLLVVAIAVDDKADMGRFFLQESTEDESCINFCATRV